MQPRNANTHEVRRDIPREGVSNPQQLSGQREVYQALAPPTPVKRGLLLMSHREGASAAEIAVELGLNALGANSRRCRVRIAS
jgi:hypothetical protein